jgi:hypothetical protein
MIKKIKRALWIHKVQRLIRQYNKTVHQYERTPIRQFALHIELRNKKIEIYAKLRNLDPDRILFYE